MDIYAQLKDAQEQIQVVNEQKAALEKRQQDHLRQIRDLKKENLALKGMLIQAKVEGF